MDTSTFPAAEAAGKKDISVLKTKKKAGNWRADGVQDKKDGNERKEGIIYD